MTRVRARAPEGAVDGVTPEDRPKASDQRFQGSACLSSAGPGPGRRSTRRQRDANPGDLGSPRELAGP